MDNYSENSILTSFFHIVFKRKKIIVLVVGLIMAIIITYTFLTKSTYEAEAAVLIKLGRENIYLPNSREQIAPIMEGNSLEQINSEIELLKSHAIAEATVKRFGAQTIYPPKENNALSILFGKFLSESKADLAIDKAVIELQKNMKIVGIKNSRVIELIFKHSDPKMAADILNAYISEYTEARLKIHQDKRMSYFFNDQAEILRNKTNEEEKRLRDLKSANNINELRQEITLVLKQKSELETQLNENISKKQEIERRISQSQVKLSSLPPYINQGEETEYNPLILNTVEAQLVQLELKKKELLAKYTENSRLVKEIEEQIAVIKNKLSQLESKKYGRLRQGNNPIYQQLKEDLIRNEIEQKALSAKIQVQKEHLNNYKDKLNSLSDNERLFSDLENEIEVSRKNYQLYLTKYEEGRISNEMDLNKMVNVSVINTAKAPLKPASPNIPINIILGFICSLSIAVVVVSILEFISDKFDRPDEVEKYLGAPVLVSIPEIRTGSKK
jgi:uncharacterized protein involved in exopolysaccharide biosynthesis